MALLGDVRWSTSESFQLEGGAGASRAVGLEILTGLQGLDFPAGFWAVGAFVLLFSLKMSLENKEGFGI